MINVSYNCYENSVQAYLFWLYSFRVMSSAVIYSVIRFYNLWEEFWTRLNAEAVVRKCSSK